MRNATIVFFMLSAAVIGCGGGSYNAKPSDEELKAMNEKMQSDMKNMTLPVTPAGAAPPPSMNPAGAPAKK